MFLKKSTPCDYIQPKVLATKSNHEYYLFDLNQPPILEKSVMKNERN